MKAPTAEEYAHTQYLKRRDKVKPGQQYPEPPSAEQISDMVEFAKLHVEACKKAILDNVEINDYDEHGQYSPSVDERSILNSYKPENIK